MALKAGYYGIKKKILNQLLGLPADISDIRSEQAVLGAKNLLPYPYIQTTRTENGITFTDNGDGTITANGTATDTTWFIMFSKSYDEASKLFKKRQKYILNGCAKGGSNETYRVRFNCNPYSNVHDDFGNGIEFTYPDDNTLTNVYIMIGIYNGTTVNNLVFKPMLRLATDPDDTYAPYAMTNRELTEIVALPDSVFTLAEGVSITSNWSCICGRVLNIGLQLEFTSAIAASTIVLTMPDYYLGNAKLGITGMSILAVRVNPQIGIYFFDLPTGSGPIKIRNNVAVAQGEKVCITGTYIIK